MTSDILSSIFDDWAALCTIRTDDKDQQPHEVWAVLYQRSTGRIDSRRMPFMNPGSLPSGADWEYGLIMAEDAPEGMTPETRLSLVEWGTGRILSCEAAEPVYDLDRDTRERIVVAWRLALRCKQRMVRGK